MPFITLKRQAEIKVSLNNIPPNLIPTMQKSTTFFGRNGAFLHYHKHCVIIHIDYASIIRDIGPCFPGIRRIDRTS